MWSEWGKRWNMGAVLGPSGLCVLEYDRPEAEQVLLELVGGDWPTTPTARTGSGRRHLYYEAPPNGVTKAARDGLELRLGAHQCVVPPSEHPDTGRPYIWELGLEPWSTPLLKVPADALAYFAEAEDVLHDRLQADPDAKVHPGQRRDQVFRLACSLVSRGVPPDAILTAARAFNETRCEPPLDDAQVVAQVDGAVDRYPSGTSLSLLPRNVGPTLKPPEPSLSEIREVPTDIPGKCRFGGDPGGVRRAPGHAGSRRRRGRARGHRRELRTRRSRQSIARRTARMRQERDRLVTSEGARRVAALEPDAADAPLRVRAQGQGAACVAAPANRPVRDPRVQGPHGGRDSGTGTPSVRFVRCAS